LKILALTGGPGCGKSTASAYFHAQGWHIIDADAVCHDLYRNPGKDLKEQLTARWGAEVIAPDGSVNRPALANAVFSGDDKCGVAELNAIVHPVIHGEIRARIQKLPQDSVVILDAALLYETGWDSLATDGVIAIWTDLQQQKKRLQERGWDEQQIAGRIAAQISADEKLARAKYGLINTTTVEDLYKQCAIIVETIEHNK
jgi:dephospho-CoA kinase